MPDKKPWTDQEDRILRLLYEHQNIKKWSTVAQRMTDDYKLPSRNGKQCKERYQYLFDDGQAANLPTQWSLEEEMQMNRLHDQIGNKWAIIASKMQGRSDNCVKNHFYSKLRKSLRKLNKVISKKLRKQLKEVRPTVLYKIIQATDEYFKPIPSISQQTINLSRILKTQLLQYSNDDNNQFEDDLSSLKQLAANVHLFNNNYKRKPKKARRGTVQAQNLMSMPKIQRYKCVSDDDDDSNFQLGVDEEESIEIVEKTQMNQKLGNQKQQNPQPQKDFLDYSKSSFKLRRLDGSYFQGLKSQENNDVEAFLKNAGVLEDADMMSQQMMKQSISESSQFDLKDRNNEKFNLNQSMERLRYSIILKQDPDIDEQNKLFRSN